MNFAELEKYALQKNGVSFDYPFDDKVRVYRVGKKIFALTTDKTPLSVNLKCDPIYSLELRSLHNDIEPGYHMNKKHWNTITCEGDVSDELFKELVDHSYSLIFHSLTKKERETINAQALK